MDSQHVAALQASFRLTIDRDADNNENTVTHIDSSIAQILTLQNINAVAVVAPPANTAATVPTANSTPHFSDSSKFFALDSTTLQLTLRASESASTETQATLNDLQWLALDCEAALLQHFNGVLHHPTESLLFHSYDSRSHSMAALWNLSQQKDDHVAIATLWSLNGLESSLRECLGYGPAQAPLLKEMIHKLSHLNSHSVSSSSQIQTTEYNACNQQPLENTETSILAVAGILRLLLLPNNGLNLRNLLWHGFVVDDAHLPRAWLALILILICNLQTLQQSMTTSKDENTIHRKHSNDTKTFQSTDIEPAAEIIQDLRKVNSKWHAIITHGQSLATHMHTQLSPSVLAWLPRTHHGVWYWVTRHWESCPVMSMAEVCVLLEQGVRLDWCRVNQRPDDARARPHTYYVTLDGHGQRHKHDLLLHLLHYHPASVPLNDHNPLLQLNKQTHPVVSPMRNQLWETYGASVMSYLTDLFVSPTGPNIRASLAHGTLDDHVHAELARLYTTTNSPLAASVHTPVDSNTQSLLHDQLYALLVAMQLVSSRSLQRDISFHYSPTFSYTATTLSNLCVCRDLMVQLSDIDSLDGQEPTGVDGNKPCVASSAHGMNGRTNSTQSVITRLYIPFDKLLHRLDDLISALSINHGYTCIVESSVASTDTTRTPTNDENDCPLITGSNTSNVWSIPLAEQEHAMDQVLVDCGAARTLVGEVVVAATRYVQDWTDCQRLLMSRDHSMSTRQRRQCQNMLDSVDFVRTVYAFATFISLSHLSDGILSMHSLHTTRTLPRHTPVNVKVVERTRMMLSTFSTFQSLNMDRATKCVMEYAKAKLLNPVIDDKNTWLDLT
jgi:hypothetical protein